MAHEPAGSWPSVATPRYSGSVEPINQIDSLHDRHIAVIRDRI
jgi:hypothetical protein